jgi:hypothetical protein
VGRWNYIDDIEWERKGGVRSALSEFSRHFKGMVRSANFKFCTLVRNELGFRFSCINYGNIWREEWEFEEIRRR